MAAFTPKNIVCAVDLSSASNAVVSWAAALAKAFDAKVTLLHADWSDTPRYFTEGQIDALNREIQDRKSALARELRLIGEQGFPGLTFEAVIREGHAVTVILEYLRSSAPDMLVMGSHGHSGVARLLLGSVAENVAREATCPVLITKAAVPPDGIAAVLCPVNFTEIARSCVEVSCAVSSVLGAKLDLLQAIEGSAPEDAAQRRQLCDWIPRAERARCSLSEVMLHGDAAEEIVRFSREHSVQLIVLGAQHRSFLEFTSFGRTTERVMRHAPCSVLIVPNPVPHGSKSADWQNRLVNAAR